MSKKNIMINTAYGVGNLGYSAINQTISSYIMFFGTTIAGIPGTLVGIAISIATVWDAITDPVVGHYSDKINAQNPNSRQNFMLLAAVVIAISNIMIWSMPLSLKSSEKFIWLLIGLLIYETADTFFATPYNALGFEMAKTTKESTSIQSIKTIFYLLGMLLPSAIIIISSNKFEVASEINAQNQYVLVSYITSSICIISAIISSLLTRIKKHNNCNILIKKQQKIAFFAVFLTFFSFFRNKNFKYIIFGYCISMIATAFLTSIGMHVFTYSFHFSQSQISILLLTLISGAMLSQFFINKLCTKYSKITTLKNHLLFILIGMGLIAIIFALRTIIPSSISYHLVLLFIAICGFGSGALYSLPLAIFSDYVRKENNNSTSVRTATLSGLLTFCFKVSSAVGIFIIGVLLDIIKFSPSEPVQTLKIQNKLGVIMFLGIGISISIAINYFSKCKNNTN